MSINLNQIFSVIIVCLLLFNFSPVGAASNGLEGHVYISEIVASNQSGFPDQFIDYPDWIEIHNNTTSPVNLFSWALTDSRKDFSKWMFPSIVIPSGGYMVVFASGKNLISSNNYLHTNFNLSSSGEYLALVNNKGEVVSAFTEGYPLQYSNVSYAYIADSYQYCSTPTPGLANVSDTFIIPPQFSKQRGLCTSPFDLQIFTGASGQTIRYTIDGSEPSLSNGSVYTGTIKVDNTTVIRAIAFQGNKSSSIITNTYIFVADVLNQPALPNNYPATWGKGVVADYEMDPEVTTVEEYRKQIIEAFNTMPIVSIVSNLSNFFSAVNNDSTGGIYVFTEKEWERPASFEIIEKEQNKQINCGVRLQGGASRTPSKSPKHSLRLFFRSKYGASKFEYKLFEDSLASQSFNTIGFKAGYNNSWIHSESTQRENSQYMRDVWTKRTFSKMGNLSLHTKYANLFLNGLYWGLYNISEFVESDFLVSYLGGNDDDYDIVKDNEGTTSGTMDEWNNMMTIVRLGLKDNKNYYSLLGKNSDGTINSGYPVYLNVENLSDYMILNLYGANQDWDHHNWIAARSKSQDSKGFQFFIWDAERILEDVNSSVQSKFNSNCPSEIFQALKQNSEFKLLFADRVQKHLFNSGSLTPETIINNWENQADEIQSAVYAESARWGDYRRDVSPKNPSFPLYTPVFWEEEKSRLTEDYFPERTEVLLSQFIKEGLYPTLAAPTFNQYGGKVFRNFELEMTATEGKIYYSLKGDPRLVGGNIASDAAIYSNSILLTGTTVHVWARSKSGTTWSALTEAVFEIVPPVSANNYSLANSQLKNYPNPVRTTTTIQCDLPKAGIVMLEVVDLSGRTIYRSKIGYQPAGRLKTIFDAKSLTNGVYHYRIKAEGLELVAKMVVLK